MKLSIKITVLIIFISSQIFSQRFSSLTDWKRFRREISFGVGGSNYLGDLGGRNKTGSDFIFDLEPSATSFVTKIAFGYKFSNRNIARVSFHYGMIRGSDKLTSEPFRNHRNLSFKTSLYELGVMYELHFIESRNSSLYNLKNNHSNSIGVKGMPFGLYGVFGISVLHFNPKSKYIDGKYYSLQPLGTEGQGLPKTVPLYPRYTIAFPLGLGISTNLSKQSSLSLEIVYRVTLTDYLDDVSGLYFDKKIILEEKGDKASYFSDPSDISNHPERQTWTEAGELRGNSSNNDGFLFATLNYNYKLKQRGRRRSKIRAKF